MINEHAIKAVFIGALNLKPDESCLIVADTIKEPIGRAFYEHALTITPDAKLIVIDPTREHGCEPPEDVVKEMLEHDVELLITERSLTHTKARREATASGARIATMPSITEDIANRCLDIDYDALRVSSNNLYDILKDAKEVRVTTELGTDITFHLAHIHFFGKNGGSFDKPGAYGNLPEGEVSFAPTHCEGVYVVDASFPGMGVLEKPIAFHVEYGTVYEIAGIRSDEIKKRLDDVGPDAYKVAELGIGLNPKAKVIGNILEDEKVIGTVHIAVGNNLSYGGDNDVPIHLDGVIRAPNIYVDRKMIMERGEFL